MESVNVSPELATILRRAQESRMYGQVEIEFHDGEVVLIRETKTTKPDKGRTHATKNFATR